MLGKVEKPAGRDVKLSDRWRWFSIGPQIRFHGRLEQSDAWNRRRAGPIRISPAKGRPPR